MNENKFSRELFAQFARIGKAISSPARVEIIYLLSQGEKSVEQLARAAQLSVANTSQHLQHLKSARMVNSRKMGQKVLYRPASQAVDQLWQRLQLFGEENLLEVRELSMAVAKQRNSREPVTRAELQKSIAGKEVTVLDVRPEDEYNCGHISGALSIPLPQLEQRMEELPENRLVVVYCRGPYSTFSHDAVKHLKAAGYEARRLEEGFPEWKSRKLPVEGEMAPIP